MSSSASTIPPPTKGPPGPKEPPPMTPEELQAFIKSTPKHKHIVKLYTPILVMAGVSTLFTAVFIGTSCSWGLEVVRAHKWLIFHYTCIGALAVSHALFCWRFQVDIENLEDPSQFQIDIGRIIITAAVQVGLYLYLFIKLKTVADLSTFELGCADSCTSKLKWMRISPFVGALLLVLFGTAQLWLCLILYHNPVLNPPPKPAEKDVGLGGPGSASDSFSDSEGEGKGLMGAGAESERRKSTGDGFSDEETLVGSAAPSVKEASLGRKGSRTSGKSEGSRGRRERQVGRRMEKQERRYSQL